VNRLEHHIERNLRQIADRATPSPDAWNLILARIADQGPETETEIIMLTETTTATPTPTPTRRWLIAAAALVAVVVAGIALVNSTDDDQSPEPTAVATAAPPPPTLAPTTSVAPRTQTVRLTVTSANIPVTFTAPVDWTIAEGWSAHKSNVAVGLLFDDIKNIYADGCHWVPADPPVGSTVDDLATAWANVPDFAATAPVDVTVDGYAGKQIEFTVPDYTDDDCRGISPTQARFALWYTAGDVGGGFYAQGPNQHTEQRILDIDGTRLVITALYLPRATPQDRADLDEALASIQIG
jgi:hypothetical protein